MVVDPDPTLEKNRTQSDHKDNRGRHSSIENQFNSGPDLNNVTFNSFQLVSKSILLR